MAVEVRVAQYSRNRGSRTLSFLVDSTAISRSDWLSMSWSVSETFLSSKLISCSGSTTMALLFLLEQATGAAVEETKQTVLVVRVEVVVEEEM